MAKESLIRKKAVGILEKEGFVYWYPAKVKFKQNDIFGVFDLVCWRKRTTKIKFLQLTTLSNLSARKKKIEGFLRRNRFPRKTSVTRARAKGKEDSSSPVIEIWGWNQRKKDFKIEKV